MVYFGKNLKSLAIGLALIIAAPINAESYVPTINITCERTGNHIGNAALNKMARRGFSYYNLGELYSIIKGFNHDGNLSKLEELLEPSSQCVKDIRQGIKDVSGNKLTLKHVVTDNPSGGFLVHGYLVAPK